MALLAIAKGYTQKLGEEVRYLHIHPIKNLPTFFIYATHFLSRVFSNHKAATNFNTLCSIPLQKEIRPAFMPIINIKTV